MKIERTTTGLIIHQPSVEMKKRCLKYFSLKQPVREYFIYSGSDPDKKPVFGLECDVVYITSGLLCMKDLYLQSLRWSIKDIKPRDGANVSVTMNRQPRSRLQEDCIRDITRSKKSKITIEVKPGVDQPAPAYGDMREKFPLNCWNDNSNAYDTTT